MGEDGSVGETVSEIENLSLLVTNSWAIVLCHWQ